MVLILEIGKFQGVTLRNNCVFFKICVHFVVIYIYREPRKNTVYWYSNIFPLIFYEIFANQIKCKHLIMKMNVYAVEKKNWSKRGHIHTHTHLQTCAEKDVKS